MTRFKFPLESLRVLRKQKERAAQQRYARALTVCSKAEAQLQNAFTELETGWNSLSRELAAGVAVSRLVYLRTWCMVLEIRWRERKAVLAEARRVAELAFQEMIFAARDREGLDRFHDKARRAHEHEILREEQKDFDEMAVQSNATPGLMQLTGHGKIY
ncbi:MAG TPA: flagellar export protein FliJ [Verrucomicrobiae bacterium]